MKAPIRGVGIRRWIFQDWQANAGCRDAQLVLAFARTAQWAYQRGGRVGYHFCTVYGLICSLVLKIELPPEVHIGPRLEISIRQGSFCTPTSS